jgi:predicted phosphodiesterase
MSTVDQLDSITPKDMPVYAETDSGGGGHAAAFLPHENATARELVQAAGLDPDLWQLTGLVNTRRWMRYDGIFLFYYKFDVMQGESEESRQLHVDELTKVIRRRTRKPVAPPRTNRTATTFGLGLADWQIGKAENGEGSDSTVQRWLNGLEEAQREIKRLRKSNASLDDLALLSVGDLIEGCGGHYDMQTFSVDLDRREQCRTVRELITKTILELGPLFDHTTLAAVPGNHGENRHKGKAFTNFSDNDDLACPEAVGEAFRLAGWDEDRLSVIMPEGHDELTMTIDLNGVNVALAHGHQFRGGVNALKKAEEFWRGQDFGHRAARDAQILFSGHFHSYHNVNITAGRSWWQAPTIDTGSAWFTNGSGVTATRGVLSMVFDAEHPLGYDHLRMLPVG